jgi:hypothetical protein
MPTLAPAAASSPGKSVEFRVWERFPCGLDTSCQPLAARGDNDVSWSAHIRDVSVGGLGVVLTRRFERGAALAIEIPAAPDCPGETLLAKVMHTTRLPDGQWLHGCAFVSQLSDDEVQSLVRLAQQQHHTESQAPKDVPAAPEASSPTWVIPQVSLVGSLPGKAAATRLARRLFLTGAWPLVSGTVLQVWANRQENAKARLRVDRCYQDGQGWIVHYTFLDNPPPELLRWFGRTAQ